MEEILTSPYPIPRSPYERELATIDPLLFLPFPPSLLPLLPVLKTLLQRTAPKEPEKTAPDPAPPQSKPAGYDL